MRQSYIPQGIDLGIDVGILPVPRETGCMVVEQFLSLEETCDFFVRSLVIAVMKSCYTRCTLTVRGLNI